jgi:hypothetical protein
MTEQATVTQPIDSVEQLLKNVKQRRGAYASGFWVPSLKRDVRFTEIDTNQQKKLIKSIVDSPVYNTEFILTLRDVLKDNCVDPDVDIDTLTIVDKLLLAVGLRISSIGNIIELDITSKTGAQVKGVSVDLIQVYNLAKDTLTTLAPKVFEDSLYIIECNVPTIGTEMKLERELRLNNNSLEIEDVNQLRDTIGDAFISEVVKYVGKVSIKTDNGEQLVAWNKFNFTDQIKIIGTFSTKLLQQIINYISTVKEEINKVELIKFELDGEVHDRRLTIDGNFFMIS